MKCFFISFKIIPGVSRRKNESAFRKLKTWRCSWSQRVNYKCPKVLADDVLYIIFMVSFNFLQAHWEAKIHSQYEETHWHGKRSYLEIRFNLTPVSSTYGVPFIYNLIYSKMIALGWDSYCINGILSVCDWNCLLILSITFSF